MEMKDSPTTCEPPSQNAPNITLLSIFEKNSDPAAESLTAESYSDCECYGHPCDCDSTPCDT
jgi:hypothetical protein